MDYPRMMFHRSREPVIVLSEAEEAALGAQWSRIIPLPEPDQPPTPEEPPEEPAEEPAEEPQETEQPEQPPKRRPGRPRRA